MARKTPEERHIAQIDGFFSRVAPDTDFNPPQAPFILVLDEEALSQKGSITSNTLNKIRDSFSEKGVDVKILFQTEEGKVSHSNKQTHQLDGTTHDHEWDLPRMRESGVISGALQYKGESRKSWLAGTWAKVSAAIPKSGPKSGPEVNSAGITTLDSQHYQGERLVGAILDRVATQTGLRKPKSNIIAENNQPDALDLKLKGVVGGKGLSLLVTKHLAKKHPGFQTPPFTILTSDVCSQYLGLDGEYHPVETKESPEVWREHVREKAREGKLHSVRSGAMVSMPGMMHTVLNVGQTTAQLEAAFAEGGESHQALSKYSTFVSSYHTAISDASPEEAEKFQQLREQVENQLKKVQEGGSFTRQDLARIKEMVQEAGFPDTAEEQHIKSVEAVLESWNSPAAVRYREVNGIEHNIGTAVIIQEMVQAKWAGVAFTHDLGTGEERVIGDFGEKDNVVAGKKGTMDITELPQQHQDDIAELMSVLRDNSSIPLEVEITIDHQDDIYILQHRGAALTPEAQLNKYGLEYEAAKKEDDPEQVFDALCKIDGFAQKHPELTNQSKLKPTDETPIGRGEAIVHSAASGVVIKPDETLSVEEGYRKLRSDMEFMQAKGESPVLVLSAENYRTYYGLTPYASAVAMVEGGNKSSHAAVAAREGTVCCVAAIQFDEGYEPENGDELTIDENGRIFKGRFGIEHKPHPVYQQAATDAKTLPEEDRTLLTTLSEDTPHKEPEESLFAFNSPQADFQEK